MTLKEYWIKAVLSNDEYSTDDQLRAYFAENGLHRYEIDKWIARRNEFLNNIHAI